MKNLIIYVHGKGGSAGEAKKEFFAFFTTQRSRFEHITLVANSIGAFFGISSLDETLVDRAYLISPIVDMEKLICNMMQWSGVTEQELALTSIETVSAFAKQHHAGLTVMPGASTGSILRNRCSSLIIGSENVMRKMSAANYTKSLIKEKENNYVRKEYYHSSGNKRRLQNR